MTGKLNNSQDSAKINQHVDRRKERRRRKKSKLRRIEQSREKQISGVVNSVHTLQCTEKLYPVATDTQRINEKTIKNNTDFITPSNDMAGSKVSTNYNQNSDVAKAEEKQSQTSTLRHKRELDIRRIYVGNLCPTTNIKTLYKHMKKYGDINNISIGNKVGSSINAYVRYKSIEDAKKARAENGKVWNGRHLSIQHGYQEKFDHRTTLFLSGLSHEVVNEDLWRVFECCGRIDRIKIHGRKVASKLGYGYVRFESPESVDKALKMEDVLLYNKPVKMSRQAGTKKKISNENSNMEVDRETANFISDNLRVGLLSGHKRRHPYHLGAGKSLQDGEPENKVKPDNTHSGGDN